MLMRGSFSRCLQRRLDRVRNVGLIECAMHLPALAQQLLQIGMQSAGHDLVDLTETKCRSQTPGNAFDPLRAAASSFPPDFLNGRFQSLRGEANGMRKARMQDQEFGDSLLLYVRCVRFAIGLECGAGTQQSDPLQIDALRTDLSGLMKFAEVCAD